MSTYAIIGICAAVIVSGLVFCWRFARALTDEPRPPAYSVRFDVEDPLAPEPFVDAQATPDTVDDAELIRCSLCKAPLSSLTASCWVCSTRKGAA